MTQFVEDLLLQLLRDSRLRREISREDRALLDNLSCRVSSYRDSRGLTDKQRNLVIQQLTKYSALLTLAGVEVPSEHALVWRTPLVSAIPETAPRIDWDADRQGFQLTFPYAPGFNSRLHEFNEMTERLEPWQWNSDIRKWFIPGNFQGYNLIKKLLNTESCWHCSVELRKQVLDYLCDQKICVKYINGSWQIRGAADTLQRKLTAINDSRADSPPWQIAWQLAQLQVALDGSARHWLQNWMPAAAVGWLFDAHPVVKVSQLPEFADLVLKINQWPLVWIREKSQNLSLSELLGITPVNITQHTIQQASVPPLNTPSVFECFANERNFKLVSQIPVPVPWLVIESSFLSSYANTNTLLLNTLRTKTVKIIRLELHK